MVVFSFVSWLLLMIIMILLLILFVLFQKSSCDEEDSTPWRRRREPCSPLYTPKKNLNLSNQSAFILQLFSFARGSSVSRSAFFIKFTKACLFLSGADEMLQISPETTGLTLCTGIYNSRLHTFVRKACAQVGVLHKHTQTHARFTLFFREPLKTLFWKIHRE